MRFKKTYNDDPLSSPKNDIVCVEPRFVLRQPVTLILKEKLFSFSGDDFSIKDINDVVYFKCKGKAFNLRDKKILYDLYQKPILNIQNKILSLKRYMKIYEGDQSEKQLASISKKSFISIKKHVIEFYNQVTNKTEYLEMKCDFFGYSCAIFYGKEKEGAPLIAKVSKKINAKLLTSQEDYYCQVAAGVDIAFMTALAICFDEYKNEGDDNSVTIKLL
jgi:uncharacterized protein YxjI